MPNAIFNQLVRETRHTYLDGNFKFRLFNREFEIEHVHGSQWRLIDADTKADMVVRFNVENKKLSFFMA